MLPDKTKPFYFYIYTLSPNKTNYHTRLSYAALATLCLLRCACYAEPFTI